MTLRYIEPLRRACQRMRPALFRPFDLHKWIFVGFASWIAGWGARGGYGYNWNMAGSSERRGSPGLEDMFNDMAESVWKAVQTPRFVLIFVLILAFAIALGIVVLWIVSRGEFVFLDAVVRDRKAIAEPWNDFGRQGDSLFVWRLVYAVVSLSFSVAALLLAAAVACHGRIPASPSEVPWIRFFVLAGILWLPFGIASSYIVHFLTHFVTPIMYRDRVTTSEAWFRFLAIFRQRPGAFLLYGLFYLGVNVLLALALLPVICLTCCVLGCLLIIPFVGTVVWLPVSYTFRAFGPEFLAQFGDDFALLAPHIDMRGSESADPGLDSP